MMKRAPARTRNDRKLAMALCDETADRIEREREKWREQSCSMKQLWVYVRRRRTASKGSERIGEQSRSEPVAGTGKEPILYAVSMDLSRDIRLPISLYLLPLL